MGPKPVSFWFLVQNFNQLWFVITTDRKQFEPLRCYSDNLADVGLKPTNFWLYMYLFAELLLLHAVIYAVQ